MEKKIRFLIIHGWGSSSREHWFLEEKERLEKLGYEVVVPDMPNTLYPKQEEWVGVIKDFDPDENSILIGHSLGGTVILRYLEGAINKVSKCVFIATPIKKLGLGYEEIENFLEKDFNWERIRQSSEKFVIFNQTKDPAMPPQHGKDLADHLGGKLIMVEGEDHLYKIDFSLLEKNLLD